MSERWTSDVEYLLDVIATGEIKDPYDIADFAEEFWQFTGGIELPEEKIPKLTKEELRLHAVLLLISYDGWIVDNSVYKLLVKRLGYYEQRK